MNDETRTDGWATADASSAVPEAAQTAIPAAGEAAEKTARPVGFCQDCGRGLSPETQRTVGTGVFCEPCLEARLRLGAAGTWGATQGYPGAQGYAGAQPGAYGPVAAPPPIGAVPGEPSPVLAALLGLIPGVGAMYNGQFAKGVMHLIIFVILVFMSSNINGIFGLFVAGWIFYQAFEAYHTAVARRDGLPLPNAFGFNDIGERMGFGRSWSATPTGQPPAAPSPAAPPPAAPSPAASWATSATPVPPAGAPIPPAGPDWIGYVPPTAFAGASQPYGSPAPPPPSAEPSGRAQQAGFFAGHAPYAETYTGAQGTWVHGTWVPSSGTPGTGASGYGAPPFVPVAPVIPPRRFPVGALWLIGLGLLILLANLLPDWRITGRWWPPVLFAGLAVWLFTRRLYSGARIACIVRWPAILMVLAIMFALHAAYFMVTFGMTCAVLLIVFGALLLVERTLGAGSAYVPPGPAYGPPYSVPTQPYDVAAEPARASFTAPGPAASEPGASADAAKGGQ